MNKYIAFGVVLGMLFTACHTPVPKPTGYYRIDIPENEYELFDSVAYPYTFLKSVYAQVVPKPEKNENYWINIVYPQFNGTIYCSYKAINNNLHEISEDTREFVYKHTIKADDILEQPYVNPEENKYGILYKLEGNTASSVQFVLTDSTDYFFRGALYFASEPNKDSIAPVVNFVYDDIVVLMETFKHK